VFSFNGSNIVVRVYPYLTSGGSPVVTADLTVKDAVFHTVVRTQKDLVVGDSTVT
jgi:hypothetical protein